VSTGEIAGFSITLQSSTGGGLETNYAKTSSITSPPLKVTSSFRF
jgi:hypothetical protein